ncbi:MAG TPA: hypothetical protein PLD73_19265, partial [Candidatus Hydrogenedentes bacterium]|nr:hypothetical protein [Candidatus Hydrogenedentota bacterium]
MTPLPDRAVGAQQEYPHVAPQGKICLAKAATVGIIKCNQCEPTKIQFGVSDDSVEGQGGGL